MMVKMRWKSDSEQKDTSIAIFGGFNGWLCGFCAVGSLFEGRDLKRIVGVTRENVSRKKPVL